MLRLPVSLVWPGLMKPMLLISVQSVCSGCGSESISWVLESPLTKRTRVPCGTLSCLGLTPEEVMVMVMAGSDVLVELGPEGELPPPQDDDRNKAAVASHQTLRLRFRI